jgi:NACalpha-BTF3-like transcription factor
MGISIKPNVKKVQAPKLAASEKSYLLASFFKTLDQDREHEQAYSTDDSDLVVNRIKVKKKRIKEALVEHSPSTSNNSNNDFAILSKDEFD